MKEYISRETALDVVTGYRGVMDKSVAKRILIQLPSADVRENVYGEWTNNTNGTFECSCCGWKHSRSKFCPNCGADMRKTDAT